MMTIDVSGKRLELFKEAVPNLSRVAVFTDVTDPFRDRLVKAYQASGERLGLSIWPVEIKTPEDIEPAFSKIAQDGGNGVIRGVMLRRRFLRVCLCHMGRIFLIFSAAR